MLIVLLVLFLIWPKWAYQWDGTGLGASLSPAKNLLGFRDYYPEKTLWDWLQLLVVPAAVAWGAVWLTNAQSQRDKKVEAARLQQEVLQAYLDRISELLIKEKLHMVDTPAEVRQVARAQTLTTLPRLDGIQKGSLITFLYESQLIKIIPLVIVDLTGADLSKANLSEAYLVGADLTGANLMGANLTKADLRDADLTGADLRKADLSDAKNTTPEQLKQAKSLEGATMPDKSKHP